MIIPKPPIHCVISVSYTHLDVYKRQHGALAGSADEQQSQRQRNHGSAAFQQGHFIGLESIGSGIVTVNQDTDKEAQVGKAP